MKARKTNGPTSTGAGRMRIALGALAAFLLLTVPARAQRLDEGELARRAERWASLDEDEREVLRRRFEELRRLGQERRRELEDRLERLETLEEELRADDPEWGRGRHFESRREEDHAWRDHVRHRLRERAGRLRDALPPRVRERLAEADPAERHQLLRELRRRLARRHGGDLLPEVGKRLGLSPEELEALEALSPEERFQELRRLRHERFGEGERPEGPHPRGRHGFGPPGGPEGRRPRFEGPGEDGGEARRRPHREVRGRRGHPRR